MRVLINAINVASAGGWGVLKGLVPALGTTAGDDEVTALVPPGAGGLAGEGARRLRLVEQPRFGPRQAWRLVDDLVRLPALVRRLGPDVLFSIGDLGPTNVACPHVMLMHNPWVTYRLARRQIGRSLRDQVIYATYYPARFRRMWPGITRIIVQTPVMAERLRLRFGVPENRIAVIPPGCLLKPGNGAPRSAAVTPSDPLKLFWPARAYPHKNHEVLVPTCNELERRGLSEQVRFFLTVDGGSSRRARRLLDQFRPCARTVTNLGPLSKDEVEHWFDQTDALFLPTLLESYSLTYLEAAARHRPVLTSDRDFARHACGSAGYYFDPENPADIADRIGDVIADVNAGVVRIPEPAEADPMMTSWSAIAERVWVVLREAAEEGRRGAAREPGVTTAGRVRHAAV